MSFNLTKYLSNNPLLQEAEKILIPRRSKEERDKNYAATIYSQIQQYIKDGGEGDLNLSNIPLTSLPNNLKVGGYLDLTGTDITSLPDNLEVGGFLDLTDSKITALPDNLKVGGYLALTDTEITSLPDNLEVGGFLALNNTQLISLPDNLQVGKYLDLRNTPISKKYSKEEIKKMVPDIKGDIYI